jgi:hypothetical protein
MLVHIVQLKRGMQTQTQPGKLSAQATQPSGCYWQGLSPVGTWVHMVSLANGRTLVCHGVTYGANNQPISYRVNSVSGATTLAIPASMVVGHYLGYNNPGHAYHGACKLALGSKAYAL